MATHFAEWEYQDDFVLDLILVDYADLMTIKEVASGEPFWHRIDKVWQGLRGISQKQHALLVTATQADAKSYGQDRLGRPNFSEDKRKYVDVIAMWGLNQDRNGRERSLASCGSTN